jgi:hypothetical protein
VRSNRIDAPRGLETVSLCPKSQRQKAGEHPQLGTAPRHLFIHRLHSVLLNSKTTSTSIALHDLTLLDEGEQVVVGRRDIDSYAVFPPDGAALLQTLQRGQAATQAAQWYQRTYGEPVDMDAFLATLSELGFLRGEGDSTERVAIRGQRAGQLLFSPLGWLLWVAIIGAAVAVSVSDRWLRPSPHHVLFCGSLLIVELTVVAGQALLALVHEGFHVLAGRRLGLRTRVRISRRLYYVVYETALDGLVTVPRSKRYLPILAGLLADILAVALLTLVAAATHGAGAHPSLIARLCLALAVTTLPRIAWQFYFYLETDIYHLISVVLGCNDLQRAARHVIARRFGRSREDNASLDPRDMRIARWYAPALAVGYLFSAVTIVLIVAPLAWQFGSRLVGALAGAPAPGVHLWDALVVLALTTVQLAIGLAIAVRERQRRRITRQT